MRLQILSDIHTEFHTDCGKQFIQNYLRPKSVDVLIIAGDMGVDYTGTCNSLVSSLQLIAKSYKDAVVLYVPGNHDFYHSNIPRTLSRLHLLEESINNLIILNNKMVNIGGATFIGTTLWFRKKKNYEKYADELNDFNLIKDFRNKVFKENRKALNFLNWHTNKDSIVITHHMPAPQSVSVEYKDNPTNMFFLCDMSKLINERKPKLWVHGHTHDSFNYMLGKTHVVCNPLGYLGRQVNPQFIPNMMIDL